MIPGHGHGESRFGNGAQSKNVGNTVFKLKISTLANLKIIILILK